MTTIFSTGPGFFAAASHQANPAVPPGKLRVYCARVEAYDLDSEDPETSFVALAGMCENRPDVATALLLLYAVLAASSEAIAEEARGT